MGTLNQSKTKGVHRSIQGLYILRAIILYKAPINMPKSQTRKELRTVLKTRI